MRSTMKLQKRARPMRMKVMTRRSGTKVRRMMNRSGALCESITRGDRLMKDIIVFSHLRWNFVYQRPQHIMSRFAKTYRVIFIEEEIYSDETDGYNISFAADNIWVIHPHLQNGRNGDVTARKRAIVDTL